MPVVQIVPAIQNKRLSNECTDRSAPGCARSCLLAGGVLLSAQAPQLPSAPLKQFGASITPSFDGWYDNPDGSHNLLIGYYNRNIEAELDIPDRSEQQVRARRPADRGQPTHFLTRRHYGMFIVTMPKEYAEDPEDHLDAHGQQRDDDDPDLHARRLQPDAVEVD